MTWVCPQCQTINEDDYARTSVPICVQCDREAEWEDVLDAGAQLDANTALAIMTHKPLFNPDVEAWQAMVRLADADQKYDAMWKLVDWTADLLDDPQRSKEDVRDWLRVLLANR
jgi:hypothetical protein